VGGGGAGCQAAAGAGAGWDARFGRLGFGAALPRRPEGGCELRFLIEGRPRISGGRGGRLYRVASTKPLLGSECLRAAPGSESRNVPAGTEDATFGATSTGGSVSAMPTGEGIDEMARGKEPDASLIGGIELRLPTPSNGAT
jgi:hypothetical protein